MGKKKYNLWFSKKQRAKIRENEGFGKTVFGILEDGSIVKYTEAIPVGSDETCNWDDAKCLGVGDYHHSE
ncbi:hypothetical protein KJ841_01820 [Patescibacteria group bacterium]|nr:hypothetical protein [Patescibacteria group bacterium]